MSIDQALDAKKALAVVEFAARQKGLKEVELKTKEYKLWADFRCADLLKEGREHGTIVKHGGDRKIKVPDTHLEDLGIDKHQSSYYRKLAKIPPSEREAFVAQTMRKIDNVMEHVANSVIQREENHFLALYEERIQSLNQSQVSGFLSGLLVRHREA